MPAYSSFKIVQGPGSFDWMLALHERKVVQVTLKCLERESDLDGSVIVFNMRVTSQTFVDDHGEDPEWRFEAFIIRAPLLFTATSIINEAGADHLIQVEGIYSKSKALSDGSRGRCVPTHLAQAKRVKEAMTAVILYTEETPDEAAVKLRRGHMWPHEPAQDGLLVRSRSRNEVGKIDGHVLGVARARGRVVISSEARHTDIQAIFEVLTIVAAE